jgi:hypothetical protein
MDVPTAYRLGFFHRSSRVAFLVLLGRPAEALRTTNTLPAAGSPPPSGSCCAADRWVSMGDRHDAAGGWPEYIGLMHATPGNP